jgi:histidinol dehydrogenase
MARLMNIEQTVKKIISDVKENGDRALLGYTEKFDGISITETQLRVSKQEIKNARSVFVDEVLKAVKEAKRNIENFHKKQIHGRKTWYRGSTKTVLLGERYTPIESVGVYIPGGTAPLISSVLMTVIPARLAGVKRIAAVTPPQKNGQINKYILAALDLLRVTEVYKVGGAQAIAALAFGTKTIPKVDKIVGPGNIYVSIAKKLVYGAVDIDMIAGPSEIAIIADKDANPEYIAADLISQAEHGENGRFILITTSKLIAEKVDVLIKEQAALLQGKEILVVKTLDEAVSIVNQIAPEHLELHVCEPQRLAKSVKNAGAIFLGEYSPVAVGDYIAGPNHVLPTGGMARVLSPLSVDDFLKKSSVICYSKKGLKKVRKSLSLLADLEGMDAHKKSLLIRLEHES